LTYITESADQELLLRNDYLVMENRLLRQQIQGPVRLNDSDRAILATIGRKLEKQALEEIATIVKPSTLLAWHRQLIARKYDGSQQRKPVGRWEPEDLCRERFGGLLEYYHREAG
jgi:putative transposase